MTVQLLLTWENLWGFSFQVSSEIINKHILFQFSRTKTNIFAATKTFCSCDR